MLIRADASIKARSISMNGFMLHWEKLRMQHCSVWCQQRERL